MRLAEVADAGDRAQHVLGARDQAARQIDRLLGHLRDVVERQPIGRRLDHVHDVVHLGDEAVDVVAIDRRDEGLVQPRDHRVGDLVALVLDLLDPLGALVEIGRVLDHVQKGPAPLDRLLSLLLEVGEERRVVREEPHGRRYISEAGGRS